MNSQLKHTVSGVRALFRAVKSPARALSMTALCTALSGVSLSAAVQYWDTSAASGLTGGTGTWSTVTTDTFWATSASPGTTAPTFWTDGNDAYFNAGTNTVTVSGTVAAGTIQNNNSNVTTNISGGSILLATAISTSGGNSTNNSLTFASTTSIKLNNTTSQGRVSLNGATGAITINGVISDNTATTDSLRISGTVNLGGTNTFGGGVQVQNAAKLTVTNANAFGSGNILFSQSGSTNQTGTLEFNLASNATVSKTIIYTGGTGNSATINSSGSGAVTYNGAMTFSSQLGSISGLYGSVGALTLKLGGTSTAANTFSGVIKDSGTGTNITSLVKQDASVWTISGANTYTGTTTVSGGTLALGAANSINNSATNAITLAGGTLQSSFSHNLDLATLSLTAGTASVLDLSTGGTFVFADSHSATWGSGATLSIIGTFTDGVSVRFGVDASGLDGTQLDKITINGVAASINSSGFLVTAIPEPSTYAALAGTLCATGALVVRRRRDSRD